MEDEVFLFCSTVGAVTEETIKKYIEDQKDEDPVFKVWDEKKDLSTSGEPLGLSILPALARSN
ncbi:MAG: transposase [Holosporaceae bacterium]|nr:transposase [Holosporaceae bacterium]